ncbi:hypothetical protein [Kineococcus rubinsiae]|uniref:hypothetical protein n=1 Tax=Kineococcus rubinsiae TaxID=2609562 RepID=UPI0014317924|nr:hypothetical protein [Kineococcus rubinsiae]NIZ91802.1 hypothetical protein [Kineococcus rubinsiae]
MGTGGTVVLVLVVVLVLLAVAWAASTRAALVRLRDLAVEAGALAEQRRSRLADLSLNRVDARAEAADGGTDSAVRRAVEDAERRLAGDIAFHAAAVRAYDHRLAGVPTSWVAALTGMHPLGAAADHQG